MISATENIADSPEGILLELLLDGMFGEHDKPERAVASRHMMMQEAAQIASCIGAKRLWLTHCSPATLQPEGF